MSYVRTEGEARISVRALIKYILEEDPNPSFAEERILVMLREAYLNGRTDEKAGTSPRYPSFLQNDYRVIPT